MESRAFIRNAANLMVRVRAVTALTEQDVRSQVQKEVNQLFQGMQNPTLPSASRLRDAVLNAGLTVPPSVAARLQQAEAAWE